MSESPTPSQTIGPFFHVAVPAGAPAVLTAPDDTTGVAIEGQVYDGAGAPVTDALVEVLDGAGRFGRCPTDETGRYAFVVTASPYLSVRLFAGLLGGLDTRCYLPVDGGSVPRDDVLAALDPGRAATLLAVAGDGGLRFDIHLQGEAETIFFAL